MIKEPVIARLVPGNPEERAVSPSSSALVIAGLCPSFLWIPAAPVVSAFGGDDWGGENDGDPSKHFFQQAIVCFPHADMQIGIQGALVVLLYIESDTTAACILLG